MLLAIDQATVSGFAWGDPGCDKPEWCAIKFRGETTGEVLSRFWYDLTSRLYELRPECVVFEAPYVPRPRGPGAKGPPPPPINPLTLRRLLSMAGMIEHACHDLGIRVCEVTPAEVSKSFLGSAARVGRANKKAAYISRCAEFGWRPVTTDEADALGIWACAEAEFDPAAANRRRAALGMELDLHGPPKKKRPASANREPPESPKPEQRDARIAQTNTQSGHEIQPVADLFARSA